MWEVDGTKRCISASNLRVSIKVGIWGMRLFFEGWAGLEQRTMKIGGWSQLDGEQIPNISRTECSALSLEMEAHATGVLI